MSRPVTYKQDMPPPGGYASITYKKVPTWSPKRKLEKFVIIKDSKFNKKRMELRPA